MRGYHNRDLNSALFGFIILIILLPFANIYLFIFLVCIVLLFYLAWYKFKYLPKQKNKK